MCARGVWGQQLWHERSSGLFYCHLKTTFKTRLSLPKKKKKKKDNQGNGTVQQFCGPSLQTPWVLARLEVPPSGQHKAPGHVGGSGLSQVTGAPSPREQAAGP